MLRWLAVFLLFAPAAAAQYESNFGRVILARSDLIVHGIASATRNKVGTSTKVELTVETVLYGEEEQDDVVVYYTDPSLLKKDEAVRGLFALKRLADGGYDLVGKPVLTPVGDPEETDKLRVAREFIKLEAKAAGEARTKAFWDLLIDDIQLGGYAAQNAAVELMYIARDRRGIITEERFEQVVNTRDAARGRLTKQCRDDLRLACQGLVEARVKSLKFKHVRRDKKDAGKRKAARALVQLQEDYPRAFIEEDVKLCKALKEAVDDVRVQDALDELAGAIRTEIRRQQAEKRKKDSKDRAKIEHAGK